MKDLRSKVEELEASGGRRLKSQVSSLEAKIAGLEEQLDAHSRWYRLLDLMFVNTEIINEL